MDHQPRRRTCQGDFAAIVKEILPIDECKDVAASSSIEAIVRQIADDRRQLHLDRPRSCGVIRFTEIRVPRRSSCPNPWTPKPNRCVSKAP